MSLIFTLFLIIHSELTTIFSHRRDSFPKMDLDNNYIGDTYPLCVDLPAKQFLRKGAKYRLLGSSTLPLMHYQRLSNRDSKKAFVLSSTSTLYSELCNGTPDNCNFFSEVTLTSNIKTDAANDVGQDHEDRCVQRPYHRTRRQMHHRPRLDHENRCGQ